MSGLRRIITTQRAPCQDSSIGERESPLTCSGLTGFSTFFMLQHPAPPDCMVLRCWNHSPWLVAKVSVCLSLDIEGVPTTMSWLLPRVCSEQSLQSVDICNMLWCLREQIGQRKDEKTDWPRGLDAKNRRHGAICRSCEDLSILVATVWPKQNTAMSQRCCVEPNMCHCESHKQAFPACFFSAYTTMTSSYLVETIFASNLGS